MEKKNRKQLIGTCIILVNPKKQILLGKRKNGYKQGYYGMPGGKVEIGEPLKDCLRRELFEETGLKFKKIRYVGVIRETQTQGEFIHFVYIKKNVTQQPINKEKNKCEEWIWTDIEQRSELNILPGHESAIHLITQNKTMIDLNKEQIN